jgi:hypothetical protein
MVAFVEVVEPATDECIAPYFVIRIGDVAPFIAADVFGIVEPVSVPLKAH